MDALFRGLAGTGSLARRNAGMSETADRRQREDYVWRAMFRVQGVGDLQLEWKQADLESARRRLADGCSSFVRTKKLDAQELARVLDDLTASHSAPATPGVSQSKNIPQSSDLPSAISGLALNHMPQTPPTGNCVLTSSLALNTMPQTHCTSAHGERDGDIILADATRAADSAIDVHPEALSRTLDKLPRGKPRFYMDGGSAGADATEASCIESFLGAVHSLELTRLHTYGKLEAAHFPFDARLLGSLRVFRVATDDILAEGALETLFEGVAEGFAQAPRLSAQAPSLLEIDLSGQRVLTSALLGTIMGSGVMAQLRVLRVLLLTTSFTTSFTSSSCCLLLALPLSLLAALLLLPNRFPTTF